MSIVYEIEDVAKARSDRPVEDVTIVDCGELPLDVDADGKEDFDDDDAHTPSLSNVDAAEKVSSEAGYTPVASTLVTMPDEPSILTGRPYTVIGVVLFTVATMMFVLMGGLRWLRRLTATRRRSGYRKVDGEDLEK